MKTNAIVRIVVYSLLIIVLLSVLVGGILIHEYAGNLSSFLSFSFLSGTVNGTQASSGAVDANTVKSLDIEWAAGSITIQPGDTDQIRFSENEGLPLEKQLVWKVSGSKLSIDYARSNGIFGFSVEVTKDLVITVPRDWICEDLEIDAAAAVVEVTDLTIDTASFEGASGSCSFLNSNIGALNVDSASGNITVSGTLSKLDCDAMSSRIDATLLNTPYSIDIDTMSGDIDLTLPAETGFTVKMEAMSSDFYSEFPTTMQNGNYIHGDGRCQIRIDAMSGDVTIRTGE